jgi:hypothetical protein
MRRPSGKDNTPQPVVSGPFTNHGHYGMIKVHRLRQVRSAVLAPVAPSCCLLLLSSIHRPYGGGGGPCPRVQGVCGWHFVATGRRGPAQGCVAVVAQQHDDDCSALSVKRRSRHSLCTRGCCEHQRFIFEMMTAGPRTLSASQHPHHPTAAAAASDVLLLLPCGLQSLRQMAPPRPRCSSTR